MLLTTTVLMMKDPKTPQAQMGCRIVYVFYGHENSTSISSSDGIAILVYAYSLLTVVMAS